MRTRISGSSALVRALVAMTFLQWLAAGLIIPLLPGYLRTRGVSDALIGLAMAAFFLGALVAQYPLGRRSDRGAPSRLLFGCGLVYAVAGLGLLLPMGTLGDIGVRAVQGAAAGAAEVVTLTLVGRMVEPGRRGRAFAAVFGAQMAGMAVGPVLAGLIGSRHMSMLLGVAAAIALTACLPLLVVRRASSAAPGRRLAGGARPLRGLGGVLAASAIAGLTAGVYEGCWTLLLLDKGASSWQIGLSWSLFCVPFVAMTALSGRLADRIDPRRLLLVSLGSSVALVAAYPFVSSIPVVIALGAVEGVGVALAYPAAQLLLTRRTPGADLGRAQGAYATVQTAAIVVAAAGSGVLFAAAYWLPFVTTGVACAGLLVVVARLIPADAGSRTAPPRGPSGRRSVGRAAVPESDLT